MSPFLLTILIFFCDTRAHMLSKCLINNPSSKFLFYYIFLCLNILLETNVLKQFSKVDVAGKVLDNL